MENDPAREWQRMQETYSRMSKDELRNVANKAYDLTGVAQQALRKAVKERNLAIVPLLQRPTNPERLAMDTEDEFLDQGLFRVYVAFSATEAQAATQTLDQADIPWRLGLENFDRAEDYTGSYAEGIPIRVLRWDWYAAKSLLPPQNLPEPPGYPEGPVTCPNCQSDDVVLESAEPSPSTRVPQKFSWHCAACGHAWQDDGVEKLN